MNTKDTPLPHPASRWSNALVATDSQPVISRITYWVGLAVILGTALFLRTWNLASTDAWTDELHTLLRVRWPLAESMDSILFAANQTPFYYLLLRALPGDSILWLRMPSVIFGLLGVVLISECIVQLYGNRIMGLTLAALLAVHPMHVILSRTARFYTVLMVLALIETWCFLLLLRGRRGRTLWAVFWASSTLAYMLHYTALALPATQCAFLLALRRDDWPLLKRWGLVQISAVAPLVLWYGVLVVYWLTPWMNGPEQYSYPYLGQSLHAADLPVSVFNVLLGYDGRWTWLLLPGLVAGAAGLVAGVVDALVEWRKDQTRAYLAVLVLITFATLFGLSTLLGAQYRDRYYIAMLPAALILFGFGARRWSLPLAQLLIAAVVISSAGITLTLFQGGDQQRSEWTAVGEYVADRFMPGDALVFERDLMYETFNLHFTGDPGVLDRVVILEPERTDEAIANSIKVEPEAARVWVVYRARHEHMHRQEWEYANPLTPHLSPTSDWLVQRQERILDVKEFDGVIVFLLAGVAG